ncbi:hypothetical protein C8F04DRAFT_1273912 [Mycena alexandri]|uniref:Uncharacterized protein n=1 Tax=Mycena alexandri TaxID=1745969 RepID=A0AAD6WRW3_9AGAR|nr:hypothetical protein C8F04DRAFT_1273912 [Mycena alexandri]
MNCTYGSGGPPMNTDISGIGVRVSFYLQTLFLSCLSARAGSLEEIKSALYTLLFTNTAMAVTALILGLKPKPEISFHDALVVFYLLYLSWVTVYFSLPACARFDGTVKLLQVFSIIQSYTVFAFAFAVLINAKSFGYEHTCNRNASVVIFRPFNALKAGRPVGWVVTGIVVAVYTGVLIRDHLPQTHKAILQWIRRQVTKEVPATDPGLPMDESLVSPPQRRPQATLMQNKVQYNSRRTAEIPKEYDLQIAWNIVINIGFVLVLWALTVMNTELLIRWNHFAPNDTPQSSWQFGQVLPMFLVVLPLANLITAFRAFGLRPQVTSK